jgi:hypothetical protein
MVSDRILVGRLMKACDQQLEWHELTNVTLKIVADYENAVSFVIYCDDDSGTFGDNYHIQFRTKRLGEELEGSDSLSDVKMVPLDSSLDFGKKHDLVTKEMAVDEFVKRQKFYSHHLYSLATTLPPPWFARTLYETGNLKLSWEAIENSYATELEGLQKCTTDFQAADEYILVRFNGENVFVCDFDGNDGVQTLLIDNFGYVYGKHSTVFTVLAYTSVACYAEKHATSNNAVCVDHLRGAQQMWDNMIKHNILYHLSFWDLILVEYEGKKLMVATGT